MSRRWRTVSMLVLPLLLAAGVALAEEPATDETVESQEQGIPVTFAGMQVFFDPESGQMRAPTPQEAKHFSDAMSRLFGPLQRAAAVAETRADGTLAVQLDLSLMDFSVVQVQADGSLQADCVQDASRALAAVAAPADRPTAEEK